MFLHYGGNYSSSARYISFFLNTVELIRSRKCSDYPSAINLPEICQMEMQGREEDKTYFLFYRSVEKLTLLLNLNDLRLDNSRCENLEFCEETLLGFEGN
jgi:hypothetical protein